MTAYGCSHFGATFTKMGDQFYYANANSQPVGPLSLEEIRRFAAAGIIESDVYVCEAGGEEWKPLTAFAGNSRKASPPLQGPPLDRPVSDEPVFPKALRLHYRHAVLAAVIAFLFGLSSADAASRYGGSDPNTSRLVLVALTGIWALAAEILLLLQLCKAVPRRLLFTSPGKATGFLFIPGFHLYWAFRLFPGLSDAARQWNAEVVNAAPDRPELKPLAYLTSISLAVVSVVVVLEGLDAIPRSLGNEGFIAFDYVIRFTFYSALIAQFHQICDPTAKPKHVSGMLTPSGTTSSGLTRGCSFAGPVMLVIYLIGRLLQSLGVFEP